VKAKKSEFTQILALQPTRKCSNNSFHTYIPFGNQMDLQTSQWPIKIQLHSVHPPTSSYFFLGGRTTNLRFHSILEPTFFLYGVLIRDRFVKKVIVHVNSKQ